MDPSKIQLDVPISFFHYPNFSFISQLLQHLSLTNQTHRVSQNPLLHSCYQVLILCPLFFIFTPNDSLSKTKTNTLYFIKKALFIFKIYICIYIYIYIFKFFCLFLFFCFLSTLSRFETTNESGIFILRIQLLKVADEGFEITQKSLCITSSNFVR